MLVRVLRDLFIYFSSLTKVEAGNQVIDFK